MTVHSAEGKAATDIIQANIDRFTLLLTTEIDPKKRVM